MSGYPMLVCPPPEPALRPLISGRSVIVAVDDERRVPEAISSARGSAAHFKGLLVRTSTPLGSIAFDEAWETVPLALFVRQTGDLGAVIRAVRALRRMRVKVFVPADTTENLLGLRVLSSLGVDGVVDLTFPSVNWEVLADLMAYALLGIAPHADIEPFSFLAKSYVPGKRLDFASCYFSDPSKYLHVDGHGNVALTRAELEAKNFLDRRPWTSADIAASSAYRKHKNRWREDFVEVTRCSSCAGHRLCLGKFAHVDSQGGDCGEFFVELMDVIERHQSATASLKRREWPL